MDTDSTLSFTSGKTIDSRPLFFRLLLLSLFTTFLLSALYLCTPLGNYLDTRATDFIIKKSSQAKTVGETVVVNIDDKSLKQYGQWPWPRYRLAMLLDAIRKAGARTIAINIIFPEPDRTSPIHWQNTLHHDLGYSIDTSSVPKLLRDHDAFLANTLTREGNYILGYEMGFQKDNVEKTTCNITETPVTDKPLLLQTLQLYSATSVLCNTDTLNLKRIASGFFNGSPDEDGILRRLPLMMKYHGEIYSSFALQSLVNYQEIQEFSIVSGFLGAKYLEPGRIPIDNRGNYILGGKRTTPETYISASELLNQTFDPLYLKDKVVFIGLHASGITQEYQLATGESTSMVDIHRQAFASLNSENHYFRGSLFWTAEFGAAILLMTILVFSLCFFRTKWTCLLLLILLISLGIAALFMAGETGMLFSPLLPWGCLLLNFFILVVLKYKYHERRSALKAGNALQLLEASQETLQSILNTIPDIVFRLDEKGHIVFLSSAVSKYKQLPTPLLGRSIFDLVLPEDREKAQYRLNERRTGARATSDFELRLSFNPDQPELDTRTRYFSVSAAGLYQNSSNSTSKFTGTQGIVRDISKRKRIENELLRAKKMEAMGNLAAGIAHDLNNILTGLVSYPDMILMGLDPNDPLYKQISLIQKSGKKAAVIVQDLLTLARRNIQIDKVCNLSDLANEYLESAEHSRALKSHANIEISTSLAADGVNTLGSPVHLSKAIMNLVNNALESMVEGGEIKITTSTTNLSEHYTGYEQIPPGKYACLKVEDSGVGIATSDVPKIFEPFYTKKPTASKGTGLGMTIIWATIKDHKGFIDISSNPGKGTTITLYLPVTEQQIAEDEKPTSLADYRGSETLLIIDDVEEQLIIAKNILEKMGYTVFTAQTPERGLELLSRQHFDLVLLDMIMPGHMDGLETYREIVKTKPGQKTIIISGYSESERVKKMQQLGAGGYLQKPYTMDELAQQIRLELNKPKP